MQEKFILQWSSSTLLPLLRSYTVMVGLLLFPGTPHDTSLALRYERFVFVYLQEAAFCLWLWWQTAAWTSDPCGASGAVTVGSGGRLDGASRWASCCPETTWVGPKSILSLRVAKLLSVSAPLHLFYVSSLIWFWHVFLLSSRREWVFQCQLCSWSCCHGASSVHPVPRPEVLHTPEELPLWNVSQWTFLQQPGSSQVRLDNRSKHIYLTGEVAIKILVSLDFCLFWFATDVLGAGQEMLRLWTI